MKRTGIRVWEPHPPLTPSAAGGQQAGSSTQLSAREHEGARGEDTPCPCRRPAAPPVWRHGPTQVLSETGKPGLSHL